MKTVVGLFETKAKAYQVKAALLSQGFKNSDVSVMDESRESYTRNYDGQPEHESLGERIKHFFGVFGQGEQSGHEGYTSGVEGGGAIVSVRAEDQQATTVADLLEGYGASQVEDQYASGAQTLNGDPDTSEDSADGRTATEQVVPIVQEELEVEKRQVNRGGVRVYSHTVETPVTENVSLRNEKIFVERRPVNRAASDADFTSGSDVVELTAVGEEAVVVKTTRVVEEVRVGKVATDRTEQIHDTVRHTEVDVEHLPGETNKH